MKLEKNVLVYSSGSFDRFIGEFGFILQKTTIIVVIDSANRKLRSEISEI